MKFASECICYHGLFVLLNPIHVHRMWSRHEYFAQKNRRIVEQIREQGE